MDTTSKGQRAVVLGGTGFIGQPVCRALAERGYDVIAVARHPHPVPDATEVVPLDLSTATPEDIATMLADHDARVVINAAGGMWGLTEDEMVDANVTLTEHVLAAAAALPSRPRLVHIGSVHEYGLIPIGLSMDEELPPVPVSAYGQLKLRCTEAVVEAATSGQVDGIVLRIGNVTGAGQPGYSLLGKTAAQLSQAAAEGRPAVLDLAPLASERDFVNLGDAIDAITTAATIPTLPTALVNVGSGQATSARTMIRLLVDVSGVPTELNEAAATSPAEVVWQQMRVDRAERLLGWAPNGDLSDGVRDLWENITESVRA